MPIALVGSEFLVNSTTANDQLDPHISVLSDGRIVVTYDSFDTPNDGNGTICVRARILDPSSAGGAANDFCRFPDRTDRPDQIEPGRFRPVTPTMTRRSRHEGHSSEHEIKGRDGRRLWLLR